MHQTDNQRTLDALGLRAKLSVSQPGDPDENEADRAADAFVGGQPVPIIAGRGASAIHRQCANCDDMPVARKADRGAAAPRTAGLRETLQASRGEPLSPHLRHDYERFFKADLSQVRVHRDDAAHDATHALSALALTRNNSIYFGPGHFDPMSRSGQRLLAHELAHVQQGQSDRVRRQHDPQPGPAVLVPREGAKRMYFGGVMLADDAAFMRQEIRHLIQNRGASGAAEWAAELVSGTRPTYFPVLVPPAHNQASGGLRPRTQADAARENQEDTLRKELTPTAVAACKDVFAEASKFLSDFYEAAKTNARKVLQANKEQTEAERERYGLQRKETKKTRYKPTGEGPVDKTTEFDVSYSMDATNPAAKGLQAAAQILLTRRLELDKLGQERMKCYQAQAHATPQAVIQYGEQAKGFEKTIGEKTAQYKQLRAVLSGRYPDLAAYSELGTLSWNLETLAKKGPGGDMAALLGERIYDQLEKIEKVDKNLDNKSQINLWQQSKIVGLTKLASNVDAEPWKARVLTDKVKDEEPGILFDIALAVLNIAALILAGPTGGISLAVAAGVNAVVAAVHVEEYLMKDALSGTAFDKAQAISQEEPSLIWLAIEIVGVFGDAAAAGSAMLKAFRTLKGPVEAVRAAKAAEEAEEAAATLRRVADDALHEPEAVKRVVSSAQQLRKGEEAALELAGAGKAELKALTELDTLTEGEAIGKRLAGSCGEVNLAKTGHIYSCSSPCRALRDKYAAVIAKDPAGLGSEVSKLESEGKAIAQRRQAAEAAGNAKGVQQAEKEAAALKQKVADLEPKLKAQTPERLAKVKWVESLKGQHKLFDQIGTNGLERVLGKMPDIQAMKGQLLEELLGARMADKAAREATAGVKAVSAAKAAGSEIEFIPGHLIKDANGQLFTDGILAYREGDKLHVVAILESKAGKASAQKLKNAWKDFPRPSTAAEADTWRTMNPQKLESLKQSKIKADQDLARKIERWKDVRAEAIEELRETDSALANVPSSKLEASHGAKIDELMDALPKSESGQARKSLERLAPNEGADVTGIRIGTEQADGSIAFKEANVTGSTKTTKLVGVVPNEVKGANLKKIADQQKITFELMNDLGVTEPELKSAVEALAAAAAKSSP